MALFPTREPEAAGSHRSSESGSWCGAQEASPPLPDGWLTDAVGMASVFWVGSAFAVTGVPSLVGTRTQFHGTGALGEW